MGKISLLVMHLYVLIDCCWWCVWSDKYHYYGQCVWSIMWTTSDSQVWFLLLLLCAVASVVIASVCHYVNSTIRRPVSVILVCIFISDIGMYIYQWYWYVYLSVILVCIFISDIGTYIYQWYWYVYLSVILVGIFNSDICMYIWVLNMPTWPPLHLKQCIYEVYWEVLCFVYCNYHIIP